MYRLFARLCATLLTAAGAAPLGATEFVIDARAVTLKPPVQRVLLAPLLAAEAAPTLDGKLDEAAWEQAGRITTWTDRATAQEVPITATVRLLATPSTLYVAFEATPERFEGARFKEPKRGYDEYASTNSFELFIDPSGKGKRKCQFISNPVGLRYDGWDDDRKWNGAWKSAGTISKTGWCVEMAIPAADLDLDRIKPKSLWRGNFGYNNMTGENISWTGAWGAPGTDFAPIFFGTEAQYRKTLAPSIGLWLDRSVYDLRDATGVALLRVTPTGVDAAKTQVRLRLDSQTGARVAPDRMVDADTYPTVDLTLDMKSLAPGAYRLTADLLQAGEVLETTASEFYRADRPMVPKGEASGRIPIRLPAQPALVGMPCPVNTGVPFAQGVLTSQQQVRLLTEAGVEIPFQTDVRSTWNRGGSIQWLGLDFVAVAAADVQTVFLEYGPAVKRPAQPELVCEQTDARITVTTGPLRFSVDRQRFNLLEQVHLDTNGDNAFSADEQVLAAGASDGLFLVDQAGTRYQSVDDQQAEVVIEERGPVRVTIRATGWYVREGSDGARTSVELPTDRLCKFTVRLTAWRGLPTVHATVTTVMTFDSNKVQLRNLGLSLRPRAANGMRLGLDGGELAWDKTALARNPHLLQRSSSSAVDDAGAAHARGQGWTAVSGRAGDVRVALRNFWRLFPKEIEWRDGALNLHVWPAHGREVVPLEQALTLQTIYKLPYVHQGELLNFRFPKTYEAALDAELEKHPGAFGAYYLAAKHANAQGLGIHNEWLFDFRASGDAAVTGEQLQRLLDDKPHALADPVYLCATGVFGPLLDGLQPAFAEVEKSALSGFKTLTERKLPNDEYGMFIHGGTHTYWRYHLKPPHAGIHRVWMNGHYQIGRMPFVQYARTGNPEYMAWGRDHADYLREIAMVHYTSDERHFQYHSVGAMYHCKGFVPWGGDSAIAAHPAFIDFLIYDYYLFGN
jgi:hypothetical protein